MTDLMDHIEWIGAGLAVALALSVLVDAVEYASDHYCLEFLPGARWPRLARLWCAPGAVVHHVGMGRCRVVDLDRGSDLDLLWVCVRPLGADGVACGGAAWVPIDALDEDAALADDALPPAAGGGL